MSTPSVLLARESALAQPVSGAAAPPLFLSTAACGGGRLHAPPPLASRPMAVPLSAQRVLSVHQRLVRPINCINRLFGHRLPPAPNRRRLGPPSPPRPSVLFRLRAKLRSTLSGSLRFLALPAASLAPAPATPPHPAKNLLVPCTPRGSARGRLNPARPIAPCLPPRLPRARSRQGRPRPPPLGGLLNPGCPGQKPRKPHAAPPWP